MELNPALAPAIQMVGIDTITPDEGNVNTHSDDQIAQIAGSIRDFGFNDPIAVDQDGLVVEGHGRLMAARALNLAEVPIIRLRFDSVEERQAYAIAHNRTQQLTQVDEKVVLNEFDRIGVEREQYGSIGYTEDDVLFMRIRAEQAEADAEANGAGGNAKFAVNKAPTTVLQFSGQDKMFAWLHGLDWLRDRYPEAVTMADRLNAFVAEYGEAL